MNCSFIKKLTAILVYCLVFLNACSVPDMHVSQGLQQDATALPVEGRSAFRISLGKEKGFGFGTYQLSQIQRGWTRRVGTPENLFFQVAEGYQPYSFDFTDSLQQKTWWVQAAAQSKTAQIGINGASVDLNKQREFLQVAFQSMESGTWQLALADPGHYQERINFIGKLSNGKEEIEVTPLYKWEGKTLPSSEAIGYEFSKEGQVLASVEIANQGKVWLKNSLSPDLKMVLASASASLLLYQKVGEPL